MHTTLPSILLYLHTLFALAIAAPGTSPNPTLVKRTNPKANEYASEDCSGPLNYGHQPGICSTCVKMDSTTNSVYLASGDLASLMAVGWEAYGSDNCASDWCTPGQGGQLQKGGSLQKANGGNSCMNLNTLFSSNRINSIYYNICLSDCAYGPTC